MSASRKEKEAKKVDAESEVKPERRLCAGELRKYLHLILLQQKKASDEAEGRVHCPGLLAESIDQANEESFGRVDDLTRERARKLLGKIKEVLRLFDEGEYGICQECGEQIPRKQLDSHPVKIKCTRCKTESENNEARRMGKPVRSSPWQSV